MYLDEPTVGLDSVLRQDLWALFTALARSGTTLLVSSHVMDEGRLCERILFLRNGQLLADGPTTDVLARAGTTRAETAFLNLAAQTPSLPEPREPGDHLAAHSAGHARHGPARPASAAPRSRHHRDGTTTTLLTDIAAVVALMLLAGATLRRRTS
ncbi:hypothetical protein [Streptomyces sp. NBC_01361]|uniref:hypothetical protein n=1 Tax=Streptomyces sp. NBC_01361 TaxID=2903838 RepID=UPI003FCD7DDC